MRETISVSRRARLFALSVLLAGGLGACVAQDAPLTECEPGVDTLSRTIEAMPPRC